ncbi:protein of unknown function DUF330 (plasmid) [Paraburkholderia phymatum STM815]|uniref:ABC-type transport auxiliary lipoprotein component domain-containing protein n=1 Tax=Paraburkholderia phymatum (strain DSM 17167 / CIP 108236 / LMG 21445 / STM815) TaxID=391038 RepID=B2JWQ3_PARP8|nr:protein of unknown function DUF330 [Paraburkholderia phymatum STM815]
MDERTEVDVKHFCGCITGILLLLSATGCANDLFRSVYKLNSVQPPENLDAGIPLAIVVDYVTIPEVVDRPQLVLGINPSQTRVAEAARWSEPLKVQIANVVAVDMQRLFVDAQVSTIPQATDRPTVRIAINVQTFDSAPGSGAMLVVGWSILTPDSKRVLNGRSLVIRRVNVGGYDALVDAQSQALAAVCVDMAEAIVSAIKKKPQSVDRVFDAMDYQNTLRTRS